MSGTDRNSSSSFDLLHVGVRRWIWKQGWESLRDIQEESVPVILDGGTDVIVAAATASGKTEAAFLPIVSRIASDGSVPGGGFEAIYVSPLRALINDQFRRIEGLCEELEIPVVKWHGDVSAAVKARARKAPQGIMLTTPESLEAILCRRGNEAGRLFRGLRHVVVDEMHVFLDSPRGRQLQSILVRLDAAAGRRVCRLGLSATLADMSAAASFLRPGDGDRVRILRSDATHGGLKLQLRGVAEPAAQPKPSDPSDGDSVSARTIAGHLMETLRGRRALVFAGSRRNVENYTSRLSEACETLGVPNEFVAHHGSLSREWREEAERRMKDPSRPCTAVCTTTMELGLDIGEIESVAQIGAGHTVSGMRQRIGRSGRRKGQDGVMRVYVVESEISRWTHPLDALRRETVQAVAMLELMMARWNEPGLPGRMHLSTLLHQILALVAQHGGVAVPQAWNRLVVGGAFSDVSADVFRNLLRAMAAPGAALIEQAPDGTLLPGAKGERIIESRDFYATFITPEEYKVVTDRGRMLGTIPVEMPYTEGQLMLLAGRSWKVSSVDSARKEILVSAGRGGTPPSFGGDPVPPDDGVVAEMLRTYRSDAVPRHLDPTAVRFLSEGRNTFASLGLDRRNVCWHDGDILLFPWVGPRAMNALTLALTRKSLEPTPLGLAIEVPGIHVDALRGVLRTIATEAPTDPVELARMVPDKERDKYDAFLGEELLCLTYAHDCIDATRLPEMATRLLTSFPVEGTV